MNQPFTIVDEDNLGDYEEHWGLCPNCMDAGPFKGLLRDKETGIDRVWCTCGAMFEPCDAVWGEWEDD